SCKIEYYIKTNSAYFSSQSAFFTDDYLGTISKQRTADETRPLVAANLDATAAPDDKSSMGHA
ncbi:hypothetical protein, partial [Bradyrhizobium sp. 33ap4]|uniref:hypothetical protein n=1 Tax=Bradyrhizobium sp. 33ap4 TaxID=3061630 RepID=UPI00292E459D